MMKDKYFQPINKYFQPINENGDYIDYWTLVNDINNLYEHIKELEKIRDNWNKLKEYISIKLYNTEYLQKICGCRIDDINHILLDVIREQMLELEQGSGINDSN